jgi:hypothetical protein
MYELFRKFSLIESLSDYRTKDQINIDS